MLPYSPRLAVRLLDDEVLGPLGDDASVLVELGSVLGSTRSVSPLRDQ